MATPKPVSDPTLLDRPLREFMTTRELAAFLGIANHSAINALADPVLRKVQLGTQCWLVWRPSAETYKAERHAGGRPTRTKRRK